MKFSQAVAAIAASASVVSAVPTAEDGTAAFTLQQEKLEGAVKHGIFDVIRFRQKYGNGTVSQGLIDMAGTVQAKSGTARNKDYADSYYTVPISVGTPGQVLQMDLDTGSSDLWVFTDQQPASNRKGHKIYQPSKSSTSKKAGGLSWSIRYGTGSARGNVYFDKVALAGISVAKQAVEAAQHVASTFVKQKGSDGLMGFAFSSINQVKPKKQKTLFANMLPELKSKVFCANLNHHAAGAYDIGFINKAHYSGAIHYTPITRQHGFWEFRISGASVAATEENGEEDVVDVAFDGVADTGTSLAFIPKSAAKAYYARVKGARFLAQDGVYVYPCKSKLPSISFTISGAKRTVPGPYINSGAIGEGFCLGGIQPATGTPFGLSIMGDTFLKSQYVVFDYGNNRLGFANKK